MDAAVEIQFDAAKKLTVGGNFNIDADITATAAEINLLDGGATPGTTAVADGHGIVMNQGGTMDQVTVQTLAAYLDDEITAMPNLVQAGALNAGSITSGFGSIDVGSSTIGTTGAITAGSLIGAASTIDFGPSGDSDVMRLGAQSATFANDVDVNIAKAGGFQLGGAAVTSTAAELNLLDGSSAGSIVASKAAIYSAASALRANFYHVASSEELAGSSDGTGATGQFGDGKGLLILAPTGTNDVFKMPDTTNAAVGEVVYVVNKSNANAGTIKASANGQKLGGVLGNAANSDQFEVPADGAFTCICIVAGASGQWAIL